MDRLKSVFLMLIQKPSLVSGKTDSAKHSRCILDFRVSGRAAAAAAVMILAAAGIAVFLLTNGQGQPPGMMFGGTLAYGGEDQRVDHLSHGIEYRLDGRTEMPAEFPLSPARNWMTGVAAYIGIRTDGRPTTRKLSIAWLCQSGQSGNWRRRIVSHRKFWSLWTAERQGTVRTQIPAIRRGLPALRKLYI